MKRAAIAVLLAVLPGVAGADYLYNAAGAGSGPRVIIALDTSSGMDKCDDPDDDCQDDGDPTTCPYGVRGAGSAEWPCDDGLDNDGNGSTDCADLSCYSYPSCPTALGREWPCNDGVDNESDGLTDCADSDCSGTAQCAGVCKSRYDAVMEALRSSLARSSGYEYAAVRFGDLDGETMNVGVGPLLDTDDCRFTTTAPLASSVSTVLTSLTLPASSRGGDARPIGDMIDDLLEDMAEDGRDNDTSTFADCRPYSVIVLTSGANTDLCGNMSHLPHMYNSARLTQVYFLGVGDLSAGTHTALDTYAKTARSALKADGTFCDISASCGSGEAMYADTTTEIVDALDTILAQESGGNYSATAPIIGTVPQELTELNRVSMNFMIYSSFTMPGYQGHFYGIRLFKESSPGSETWEFTDFTQMDLNNCGVDPDNPCVFDAGARLTTRSTARRIFTGAPGTPFDGGGSTVTGVPSDAFTVPITSKRELTNDGTGRGNLRTVIRSVWGENSTATGAHQGMRDIMWNGLPSSINSTVRPMVQALGNGSAASDANIDKVINWLHGGAGSNRDWKLGDLYHSTPSAAEKPSYRYGFPGYTTFKQALGARPTVAYVGANDGMIHAFFITPDFAKRRAGLTERWQPGDELFAYVPVNMIAKGSARILEGEDHFFSMDTSCRIDDVFAVPDVVDASGVEDCSQDSAHPEWCGWRTVVVCGEGWGGAWYVALDITEPFDPACTTGPCDPTFEPLWEYANNASGGAGLGRTWSTPGSGLVKWDYGGSGNKVRSILVFGSGYNNQMCDGDDDDGDECNGPRNDYRLLNMPFRGSWPQHGRGTADNTDIGRLFVLDTLTGQQLASFDAGGNSGSGLQAVVADIPLADLDRDYIVDVAYAGGWRPNMQRIAFHDTSGTVEGDNGDWSASCTPMAFGSSKPVSSRPAVITDRGVPCDPTTGCRVYVIAGTGLDENSGPDRFAGGNQWDLAGYSLMDTGKSGCRSAAVQNSDSGNSANMCTAGASPVKFNGLLGGGRMLGAPIMQIQPSGKRWLTFMSNDPGSDPCDDPSVRLYCVAFFSSTPGTCDACTDLDDDGTFENGDGTNDDAYIEIDTGGQIGGAPAMADGQIYVATTSGPQRLNNQEGTQGGDRVNENQPRAMSVAWREIYP